MDLKPDPEPKPRATNTTPNPLVRIETSDGGSRVIAPQMPPKEEGRMVNGQRHGLWRALHADGSLHWRQEYDHGTPIGTFTRYHENGRVAEEAVS